MRRCLTLGQCGAILRGAIESVESTVMPRRCVFCGTPTGRAEALICAGCRDDLPWLRQSCSRCAQPVAALLPEGVHCAACQSRPPPFGAAIAPLLYSFPVDAAIKALKFRRKLFYAPAFGSLLAASLPLLPSDIDALLPVPLHWQRHATRGFNQADELCRIPQKSGQLSLVNNVFRKRATPYQSGMNAKQRRRNLRSAFVARGEVSASHVLIVDDVITTGETCRQLAKVVLRAGAEKVSVLAIARATTGRG